MVVYYVIVFNLKFDGIDRETLKESILMKKLIRNARMIALTDSDDSKLNDLFESIIRIPEVDETLSPALAIVPLQLLAYYIAEFLGKDVDQPRNLAKSVTVE